MPFYAKMSGPKVGRASIRMTMVLRVLILTVLGLVAPALPVIAADGGETVEMANGTLCLSKSKGESATTGTGGADKKSNPPICWNDLTGKEQAEYKKAEEKKPTENAAGSLAEGLRAQRDIPLATANAALGGSNLGGAGATTAPSDGGNLSSFAKGLSAQRGPTPVASTATGATAGASTAPATDLAAGLRAQRESTPARNTAATTTRIGGEDTPSSTPPPTSRRITPIIEADRKFKRENNEMEHANDATQVAKKERENNEMEHTNNAPRATDIQTARESLETGTKREEPGTRADSPLPATPEQPQRRVYTATDLKATNPRLSDGQARVMALNLNTVERCYTDGTRCNAVMKRMGYDKISPERLARHYGIALLSEGADRGITKTYESGGCNCYGVTQLSGGQVQQLGKEFGASNIYNLNTMKAGGLDDTNAEFGVLRTARAISRLDQATGGRDSRQVFGVSEDMLVYGSNPHGQNSSYSNVARWARSGGQLWVNNWNNNAPTRLATINSVIGNYSSGGLVASGSGDIDYSSYADSSVGTRQFPGRIGSLGGGSLIGNNSYNTQSAAGDNWSSWLSALLGGGNNTNSAGGNEQAVAGGAVPFGAGAGVANNTAPITTATPLAPAVIKPNNSSQNATDCSKLRLGMDLLQSGCPANSAQRTLGV